ncbi:MAG: hypothetical protein QNJ70_23830 [Xenococcaceae cyanobacterium MO_207.B15]|nr:hypothetical protein [Xenococcaceae cyanobacterium MO_207.B15]
MCRKCKQAKICLFVGQNSPHRQVGSPVLTFEDREKTDQQRSPYRYYPEFTLI